MPPGRVVATARSGHGEPLPGQASGAARAVAPVASGGAGRLGASRGYCDCGVLSSTGTRKLPSLISWVRSATMVLTSAGSLSSQA